MSNVGADSTAIVVLPVVGAGRLEDRKLCRWLARSELQRLDAPRELLSRVLDVLGKPYPQAGLGALRMWGQTGQRPNTWIAAADPVYLEPRLDHLCLHAQDATEMPSADLRPLIDHLQVTLADAADYGFARLGRCGYLRATEPVATADVPPYVVHLDMPNDYMPAGEGADRYRQLVSEVEMALHDHDVNLRRQESGLQPINCLWFWGGGYAPEQETVPHPPLFTDDPLLTGYWLSKTGAAAGWPGSIAACSEAAAAGFVAVVPDHDNPDLLASCLQELRGLLLRGTVSRLVLMFGDGIEASIERRDRWRFWRRGSELLR